MDYRIEHDSMGEVRVPADRLWAAQTQRSHENFEIAISFFIITPRFVINIIPLKYQKQNKNIVTITHSIAPPFIL